MRVVADTNIVISGFLWRGSPRRVLDAARDRIIDLYTSESLLKELAGVLNRPKFTRALESAHVNPQELIDGYSSLANIVRPVILQPVLRDVDDDQLLACAVSAECEWIVSGDEDVLTIRSFQGIRMVTANRLLHELRLG
jgi:putative PIN family toxin of toxin-antitoxin system